MKWLTSTWVRVGLSLGLLALLLLWLVDYQAARAALAQARWGLLLWLALWWTLDRLLMAYKWRLLVLCRGLPLSPWESIRVYYLATFAGSFLPTTVGADALRVGAVSSPQRPSATIAASILVERALGFVASALAALAALALLLQLSDRLPPQVLWATLILLALGCLAVVVSLSQWADRLIRRLDQRMQQRGRVVAWLGRFLGAYSDYRRHPMVLLGFVALSLLEQAAPVGAAWLAAQALNIELSLAAATAVVPVAMLLARAPISLSGFGVVEGLYVAFFGLVGLSSTQAFLLGVINNLMVLATALPGAFFYASRGLGPSPSDPGQS